MMSYWIRPVVTLKLMWILCLAGGAQAIEYYRDAALTTELERYSEPAEWFGVRGIRLYWFRGRRLVEVTFDDGTFERISTPVRRRDCYFEVVFDGAFRGGFAEGIVPDPRYRTCVEKAVKSIFDALETTAQRLEETP